MPTIGETLAGRYRIDAPLGAGGMATVFRARDLRLDRDVALKVLLPNMAVNPVLAERFDREARALAAIRHPNVVAVFDVEPADPETGREPFFVMELCEQGSLAERLADAGGHVAPDEVVPILIAIADGLDALHAAGLLHRDVKPHNVLLAADRPRLADLGLAVPEDATGLDSLTASGTALGTLGYLAPERLAGEPASPAADIWGLGATAYQALTGRMPRPAATIAELADRRMEPAAPASVAAPDLGEAFDSPLTLALSPHPSDRPSALGFAGSMATALGRWSRSGRGLSAAQDITPRPRIRAPIPSASGPEAASGATTIALRTLAPSPPVRRSSPITMLAVIGLVGLVLFAVLLYNGLRSLGGAVPSSGEPSVIGVASPSPSPSLKPSVVTSPSPSPSHRPTPSPTRTATPDPFAEARNRLADVRAAIEAAKGGGGLKGKDANHLRDLAGQVDRAIQGGDAAGAREAADKLVDAVQEDIDKGRVGGDPGQRLLSAALALRDAIPAG